MESRSNTFYKWFSVVVLFSLQFASPFHQQYFNCQNEHPLPRKLLVIDLSEQFKVSNEICLFSKLYITSTAHFSHRSLNTCGGNTWTMIGNYSCVHNDNHFRMENLHNFNHRKHSHNSSPVVSTPPSTLVKHQFLNYSWYIMSLGVM